MQHCPKQNHNHLGNFLLRPHVDLNHQTRVLLPDSQTQHNCITNMVHQRNMCIVQLYYNKSDYLRNAAVGQRAPRYIRIVSRVAD